MMVGSFGSVLRDFCPFSRVMTLFYGVPFFGVILTDFGWFFGWVWAVSVAWLAVRFALR